MSTFSELTITEHCDSLRQEVDIARETAIESIHKESNTLMREIDAYERECLSSWSSVKESTEVIMADMCKRMRAFLAEQQAFLQSAQASDTIDTNVSLLRQFFLKSETKLFIFLLFMSLLNLLC